MKVEHGLAQRDYVDWLYHIFVSWVRTPPQEKLQPWRGRVDRKVWFQTVSHPALRFYGQQFYRGTRKVVPKIIHRMLTPLALAVWFMDDGSVKSKDHKSLLLNTQAFDRSDLEILRDALERKFGLATTLRRQREGDHLQRRHTRPREAAFDIAEESLRRQFALVSQLLGGEARLLSQLTNSSAD